MGGAYVGENFLIPSAMISNRAGVQIFETIANDLFSSSESETPASELLTDLNFTEKNPLTILNESGVSGAIKLATCESDIKCPACADGRFNAPGTSRDDYTCSDIICPGVSAVGDSYFSDVSLPYNCTGNGIDDGNGGCMVTASGATCTCEAGFIGDDCSKQATPDCPDECTACQNCVRTFCFTPECDFCSEDLDQQQGFLEGMLTGCDADVCSACFVSDDE